MRSNKTMALAAITAALLTAGPVAGVAANLVFRYPPGSLQDALPPQVTPIPPAAILPVGTNVEVTFRLLDNQSSPTLNSVTFDEFGW